MSLVPNPDILADVSRRLHSKRKRAVLVGFALETHQWLLGAREKMRNKGLDIIVANKPDSMGLSHAHIAILDRLGEIEKVPPVSKQQAAVRILRHIEKFLCGAN